MITVLSVIMLVYWMIKMLWKQHKLCRQNNVQTENNINKFSIKKMIMGNGIFLGIFLARVSEPAHVCELRHKDGFEIIITLLARLTALTIASVYWRHFASLNMPRVGAYLRARYSSTAIDQIWAITYFSLNYYKFVKFYTYVMPETSRFAKHLEISNSISNLILFMCTFGSFEYVVIFVSVMWGINLASRVTLLVLLKNVNTDLFAFENTFKWQWPASSVTSTESSRGHCFGSWVTYRFVISLGCLLCGDPSYNAFLLASSPVQAHLAILTAALLIIMDSVIQLISANGVLSLIRHNKLTSDNWLLFLMYKLGNSFVEKNANNSDFKPKYWYLKNNLTLEVDKPLFGLSFVDYQEIITYNASNAFVFMLIGYMWFPRLNWTLIIMQRFTASVFHNLLPDWFKNSILRNKYDAKILLFCISLTSLIVLRTIIVQHSYDTAMWMSLEKGLTRAPMEGIDEWINHSPMTTHSTALMQSAAAIVLLGPVNRYVWKMPIIIVTILQLFFKVFTNFAKPYILSRHVDFVTLRSLTTQCTNNLIKLKLENNTLVAQNMSMCPWDMKGLPSIDTPTNANVVCLAKWLPFIGIIANLVLMVFISYLLPPTIEVNDNLLFRCFRNKTEEENTRKKSFTFISSATSRKSVSRVLERQLKLIKLD